jgi:hypothetical protein
MTAEEGAEYLGHRFPFSRRDCTRVVLSVSRLFQTEGAGNAGCWPHPWPACKTKSRRQLPQVSRNSRHSLRDGFTAYGGLSPGTGLSCPRRPQRSSRLRIWPQRREARTTRFCRPQRPPSSETATTSIAPRLTCRDDRVASLCTEAGWRKEIRNLRKTEVKYFSRQDWTVESALNRLANFVFRHAFTTSQKAPFPSEVATMLRPDGRIGSDEYRGLDGVSAASCHWDLGALAKPSFALSKKCMLLIER